jgi:hypothetical protein
MIAIERFARIKKQLFLFSLIICSITTSAQRINVSKEKYPGVKKIIVKSVGHGISRIVGSVDTGYKGIYLLDGQGQAKTEIRLKTRKHLATYEYEFLANGLLAKQTTTFDINNPKSKHSIYHHYDIRDGIVYTEICYTATDTLYREDNLEFNEKRERIVYLRNLTQSKNYLTYENGRIIKWRSIELADNSERIYDFGYDKHGNVTKVDLKQNPEPEMKNVRLHGDGDHRRYKYKYDKHGRWTKMYQIVGRRKILIEKRKYEM